ncbi:phosphoribosyl 1,2-cyclic phosphodiesterase [Breoghania corrubedonensis]|uniref:Phosphoribosyl 1,2-cyclic phosphodiesterase n=1 Tax=Breoghania corrubedonensis TaxID=665038 RepID=A0A2T5V1I1_9HYPH|nr:MBL fold metallo-hydrolase [Breoghania corrubedonensis]PTW57602.1 phosphoribosyl 1,2-cyclic phosphodiesterase [Breoghania corrubedonensis]
MAREFSLRFWGVRGSTPTPGSETLRYGGETTSLEIRAGDRVILVDCGSGARKLGRSIVEHQQRDIDLLFTHTHLDHICGLPFFQPAYDAGFQVRCWAGHFANKCCLLEVIGRIMSPPIFPVAAETLKAVTFETFGAGDEWSLGDVKIATTRLNHPGGACGYRLTFEGRSIAIITDHEHGDPAIDQAVAAFVRDVDVMVYDAMYCDNELPKFRGWGHSTWQEALRLAEKAGVKRPVIFHHDPARDDDALDRIAAEVSVRHPGGRVAVQGETIVL